MTPEQKYYLTALAIICMSLVCCSMSRDRRDEYTAKIDYCKQPEVECLLE